MKTTTFDKNYYEFIKKNNNKKILLKIDTEGSELNMLQGAKESLKFIDLIILEVPNVLRFENGCSFFELSQYLAENKFFPTKIITANYANIKNKKILNYSDIVFSKN
ncbi:FkbM family methyltransferase [Alphaproteobacteria bacterium]|nr:FkbM family methyltransferase [Alphaproteobacteria bacterium]